jgi:hypothetical protein
MTDDPPSAPEGAGPEPPWPAVLAGADGEPSGPVGAPRHAEDRSEGWSAGRSGGRSAGRPRHESASGVVRGPVGPGEPQPRADWRLNVWLVGLVAAVLAVFLGTGWTVRALPGADEPGPAHPPAPQASAEPEAATTTPARSIVFVLTGAGGVTAAAAVVGADEKRATCVLTPRRLVVDVRGSGPKPLASAFAASDATGVTAVSDTLGVRVDGAWRLSGAGLAELVDDVAGPAGVRIDRTLRVRDDGAVVGGNGPREALSGAEAAAYALTAPRDASEAERQARFYAVLDGMLDALPDDAAARRAALDRLGRASTSTLPPEQFHSLLGDLHRHAETETVEDRALPVVPAPRGRPRGYDVDAPRFRALLSGPLADVRRPVKVLVQSDGESAKATAAVKSRLAKARLSYVADARTDEKGPQPASRPPTTTIRTGQSPTDLDRAREIAAALELPASAIETRRVRDAAYDVLVELGADLEARLRLPARPAPAPATPSGTPG